ncbi:MAG TPA: hypothetical protein PK668_24625 [Myxococcota bacterium]|nr:hypothetical protein [Myxococcota bacterium]HRY96875.1 hypothetical protein [Myxococcota bacterium]
MQQSTTRNRWPFVLLACAWLAGGGPAGAAPSEGFQVSPPAHAPLEHVARQVETNLRELEDARGLALLLEDDRAAAELAGVLQVWRTNYAKLLGSDPELLRMEAQVRALFLENLAGRAGEGPAQAERAAALPLARLEPILRGWLESLLQRRGVAFAEDLELLGQEDLADICDQARSFERRRDLPPWRLRLLLWRFRDTEVKRLYAERDERLGFLSPIRLEVAELPPATGRVLERYLAMLRNLRLQVLRNSEEPYETHRTLDGLLRGLRYMDTIRQAAATTGLDHRLMTRLFIQESEFVHHRVSLAGAYSVAQFLDIAVKDVWLFRASIRGSAELLPQVGSWEELKARIVADPREAIKASCLYFRRVRDGIARRFGEGQSQPDAALLDLLTLEMFSLEQDTMERAQLDAGARLAEVWPPPAAPLELPLGGLLLPDPGELLGRWAELTVRDLTEVSIGEAVYRGRLARLIDALGLGAYNAGTGNLMKAADRRRPYASLSFPLMIDETRAYVDGILDGVDILAGVGRMASGVARMSYDDLRRLADRACLKAGKQAAPSVAGRARPRAAEPAPSPPPAPAPGTPGSDPAAELLKLLGPR